MAFTPEDFGRWAPRLQKLYDEDWFAALEQRVEAAYASVEHL